MNLAPTPPLRLVAETFEQDDIGEWTLVVQHVFYGATPDECYAIMAAHIQTDAFLRSCTEQGTFGSIVCTTTTRLERTR